MMPNEITEIIKEQIKSLEAELNNSSSNEKKRLEIQKSIKENKILLETTYKDLNKRNGITLGEFEKEIENMPIVAKRATGIDLLDNIFDGGFEESMFINFVGESGSGKSTLALEILLNIAEYTPSVFFGFEMGDRTTLAKIKKYGINNNNRQNLIIDRFSRNIEELKREVSLYANDGIKFFVIDSKMKIEVNGGMDDHKKISYLSNELSKICQQLGVIIILINQLSEDSLKSGRVALKGSGDQYYDSDIILVYKKDKKDNSLRELYIEKNRQTEKTGMTIITQLLDNRTIALSQTDVVITESNNSYLGDIL